MECCCTAASSSLSKMVHSPIAVHPEAADKDGAAQGTFPLRAPPRAAPPDWERNAPQLKNQTKFLKIQDPPLPFIVLKTGKMGKETQARPTDGQLARSGERARTSGAVRGSGLEPGDGRARGGAERWWPRAGPRALARPSEVFERHSLPGVRGRGKVRAPIPAPGTSAGTGRSRAAACEAGAERAEPVAGLGNPRPPPLIWP